jgi:hypothetical protein
MTAAAKPFAAIPVALAMIEDVRAATLSVFDRFATELHEPGVDGALLWLIFNVLSGPMTTAELSETAAFVDAPEPLLERIASGGWIECEGDQVTASPQAKQLLARVSTISQRNNLAWRETITQGDPPTELDATLSILLGQLARERQTTQQS